MSARFGRFVRTENRVGQAFHHCLHRPTMERSVPVYAGVSLVPSSPYMSLVLEDLHGFRGLLLRARASDSRFALSSQEQHQGLRRRGSLRPSLLA